MEPERAPATLVAAAAGLAVAATDAAADALAGLVLGALLADGLEIHGSSSVLPRARRSRAARLTCSGVRSCESAWKVALIEVDRVGGPVGLGQDVVDAGHLADGAHRGAGDDAGAGAEAGIRRIIEPQKRPVTSCGIVPSSFSGTRIKVLAGVLGGLLDGGGNLARLAEAVPDEAVAVARDGQGGEREAAAALHDGGGAVDLHQDSR